jgi:hypothetical protein
VVLTSSAVAIALLVGFGVKQGEKFHVPGEQAPDIPQFNTGIGARPRRSEQRGLPLLEDFPAVRLHVVRQERAIHFVRQEPFEQDAGFEVDALGEVEAEFQFAELDGLNGRPGTFGNVCHLLLRQTKEGPQNSQRVSLR